MSLDLTFQEAEILASVLNKSFEAFDIAIARMDDFKTAQAFMGNDIGDELSDEELTEQAEVLMKDLRKIRQKIKDYYGI